ncbi:MAG: iron ABC transporter substrate-binding protein [Actinobacteria bacterium]|nr:iron ABC transporter substrate-binding protein [Actinomycetota bacterium]
MRHVLALMGLVLLLAACGGDDADLTVYSGRHEELVTGLLEQFEEDTGLDVEARFGDSAELAATISEEGENSPADVFFAQDAGSLGSVAEQGLLAELPQRVLDAVPERFRDPQGRWVGTSGRARVVAFNTDVLSEAELPESILDYGEPEWRGRIGLAPTNASFQAMVSSMRISLGDDRTRAWLEAIVANDPMLYENNIQTVEAIAAGEVDVGFVNHYYLYDVLREQPDAPVANHFMTGDDPGALVNVAGAAILGSTDNAEAGERFVAYLLREGQPYFAEETSEYPLVEGVEPGPDLPPLDSIHGPDLDLGELGPELPRTLEMLNEVGLTS